MGWTRRRTIRTTHLGGHGFAAGRQALVVADGAAVLADPGGRSLDEAAARACSPVTVVTGANRGFGADATGVGGLAQGPVAGAIGNAASDAVGVCVRDLPLTWAQIERAILASRAS